jgi:phosphatidylglycerol:prolipoprotein diacylglycerol transferase
VPRLDFTLDPTLVQLGPLVVGWHGVFTALAVLVAVWLGGRRAGRAVGPAAPLDEIIVWAVVGGMVGARMMHVLDHLPEYAANPVAALAIWEGGLAVYGAFLGGIAAGLVAAGRAGVPAWPLLDAAAPALLVGQAIGRLGCLSNGDAWGAPTGAGWGIVYWHPDALLPPALLGVPTHPYPLYEIAACALLLAGVWLARRRLAAPGALFLTVALGYAAIRFGLTWFRQEPVVWWGLQEAQIVALTTVLVAVGLLLARRQAGRASAALARM